jgi:uncharacterized membrane protein
VLLKGLNAALEVIAGVALLVATPALVADLVNRVGGKGFAAIYLLSHGVIKLTLVWALLGGKLWAFPVSMVVFGGFIVYQLYRYTFTHEWMLIALSIFDIFVIALIYLEYRAIAVRRTERSRACS